MRWRQGPARLPECEWIDYSEGLERGLPQAIAAVSRLAAMAIRASAGNAHVAAFVDAQREQVLGGFSAAGRESRAAGRRDGYPAGKIHRVCGGAGEGRGISWVSIDPARLASEENWRAREARAEKVENVSSALAPAIGRIGTRQLAAGRFTDALSLDANYVRRSDAEISGRARRMEAEIKREQVGTTIRTFLPWT